MTNLTVENEAASTYFKALNSQAAQLLQGIVSVPLYPVEFPSQGDFFWYYSGLSNPDNFNQQTWNYLNTRIQPGNVDGTIKLNAPSSFTNAYSTQIVPTIAYTLSTENQAKVNNLNQQATTQINSIISQYQGLYGPISQSDLDKAKVLTKIDYIIGYILGSVWSGQTPPLSFSKMQAARNLQALLPYMPASGATLLPLVQKYLNIIAPVSAILNSQQLGSWVLNSLISNVSFPTAGNNGVQLVDSQSGTVTSNYFPAISIPKSIADISNSLGNNSNAVTLSLQSSASSDSSVNVSINGSGGFSVGSLLKFNVGVSASYDMTSIQGSSREVDVSIRYPGVTAVPIQPAAWDQSSNTGWYYTDPISQAVANQGKDVDGYKFVSSPPFNMQSISNGGQFGLLSTLVISQFPTIALTYKKADYKLFRQSWSETVSGNLSLFGFLKLGSFSEGAWGSTIEQGADNSTFTLTFAPSQQIISVPTMQQQAFVISGAVNNPGVSA